MALQEIPTYLRDTFVIFFRNPFDLKIGQVLTLKPMVNKKNSVAIVWKENPMKNIPPTLIGDK